MPTLLRLDCSPRGRNAHSWKFADELTACLQAHAPGTDLVHRALFEAPPDLVNEDFSRVMITHTTAELAKTTPTLALSERLIGELEQSDALLIASPVHNFSVPAPLKAWIDQVVRFGRTFRSTPEGKIGLLHDRPTWLVLSSGGYFTQGKIRQPEFAAPYLQAILACIGIRDITIIRLEGLSRGEEAVAATYEQARRDVARHLGLATAA